jgi:hypothetical protein
MSHSEARGYAPVIKVPVKGAPVHGLPHRTLTGLDGAALLQPRRGQPTRPGRFLKLRFDGQRDRKGA